MLFVCTHVYDVALSANTVKIWLLVSDWLATPAIRELSYVLVAELQ